MAPYVVQYMQGYRVFVGLEIARLTKTKYT